VIDLSAALVLITICSPYVSSSGVHVGKINLLDDHGFLPHYWFHKKKYSGWLGCRERLVPTQGKTVLWVVRRCVAEH